MNWVCSCILHVSCRSSLKGFVLQPAAGMIVIMAEIYGRVLTRRKKRSAAPLLQSGHRLTIHTDLSVTMCGGGFLSKMDYQDPGKYPQLTLSFEES